MSDSYLVKRALAAREHAYVPYSHFAVGTALLTRDGTIYEGANIENAAYSPSNCAERTAFFQAVQAGERDFVAIAIVGGPEGEAPHELCAPCGVCRQVMMEFCDPATFRIVLGAANQAPVSKTLAELLPLGFGPDNLNRNDSGSDNLNACDSCATCSDSATHTSTHAEYTPQADTTGGDCA
nr:cytidine deaminase [Collinsella sp. zg1085]